MQIYVIWKIWETWNQGDMKLRRIGRDRLNFMPHFVEKQKSALISCRLNFMSSCFHVALISSFKVNFYSQSQSPLCNEVCPLVSLYVFHFCFKLKNRRIFYMKVKRYIARRFERPEFTTILRLCLHYNLTLWPFYYASSF